MSKITILCGESPMPVCQALKTLQATEAVIIHGNGDSIDTAKRVKNFCLDFLGLEETSVHLIEVEPWDPTLENLFPYRELLDNSILVFGPGTSVMNAMIHDWWRAREGNGFDVGQSWYLQAMPSQLIASDPALQLKRNLPSIVPVIPTGLNMNALVNLHLSQEWILRQPTPLVGTARQWFVNNQLLDIPLNAPNDIAQLLSSFVSHVLFEGQDMRTNADEQLILRENTPAHRLLQSLGIAPQPGFLLEVAVYALLGVTLQHSELARSIEVVRPANAEAGVEEGILEMDVAIRHLDRLLWISCGSSRKQGENLISTFRTKFHEADSNARNLSGKEARSITVVNRFAQHRAGFTFEDRLEFGKDLRTRLGLEPEPSAKVRHIIVDVAELFGRNPEGALNGSMENPGQPWLKKWIEESLGLNSASAD